ncbi:hypothetical protein [Caballeronia sp. LZ035]|uniref:hypothetical protein n=1 Tax=Caballeronia sp. LZ035 TaxID=3038568 RepID=UPI00285B795A|nr:hypothetical protein [Caballeronia sp. LZ035]MDR5763081.1 hypothetical protein [Caballeronia sp. LZ035]
MTIIGVRRKQRTVPMRRATVNALRAHWQEQGLDFGDGDAIGAEALALTRLCRS